MQGVTKDKLSELQHIITRMPLDVFCVAALPEFGVRWRELAKAVRNARLPMQPASVARVLCNYVSKALTADEMDNIVARLRLKPQHVNESAPNVGSQSVMRAISSPPLTFIEEEVQGFPPNWNEPGPSRLNAPAQSSPTVAHSPLSYVEVQVEVVATQPRIWHVIRLLERTVDEPVAMSLEAIPGRITQVLLKNERSMRPEVQTVFLGDLMYLSIQLVSYQEGSTLYVATPPGEAVALVSSVAAVGLLKATVEGLGYKKYANANLYGRDIKSLLRINDRSWNANAEHLAEIPEYAPTPVITDTGIDYTNKNYDENYVDNILGPDPPVITDLNIKTTKYFFDRSLLNKTIKLTVNLKTEDLAKTLKSWIGKGAIAPTSDLIQIFHQIKSNKL